MPYPSTAITSGANISVSDPMVVLKSIVGAGTAGSCGIFTDFSQPVSRPKDNKATVKQNDFVVLDGHTRES